MTILTPMDQLKEQERIHKNNLLDLNEYPLRSEKKEGNICVHFRSQ